ncbi:MAG: type II toxin-antitoxin system HicB family antitoxin [Armatimonadetes bacterium]|nr:type II toxin-antitoxin system HicB family antitoxin [Armatimonadota bacterium]
MPDYRANYQRGEDGWIVATVPELPGAVSQGRTLDEARAMLADAIRELLASYRDDEAGTPGIWETVRVEM